MTPDPLQWVNDLSAYLYAMDRDTPAKTWADAEIWHPAIGRQLRIDRAEDGGVYALAPFRLAKIGESHRILAAWPAPHILTATPDDHLVIKTVIAWNPVENTAEALGDPEPQLIGRFPDPDSSALFADPRAFFQAWAISRAAFFVRWRNAMAKDLTKPPTETDLIPGCLISGDIEKVRFPADLPSHIDCIGIDPRTVNKAIFKAVRLPRVTSSQRAAA